MPQNTTPRGYTYPLYDDPMSFPAQIQDLAQDIDTDMTVVADRITDARNRPSARLTAGGATGVPVGNSSIDLPFLFGTIAYDNAGMASIPGGSLTLAQPGIYLVSARVTMQAAGAVPNYTIQPSIRSSGGSVTLTVTTTRMIRPQADSSVSLAGLHFWDGTGSDVLTLQMRHSATASRTVTFRNLCASKISNIPGGS